MDTKKIQFNVGPAIDVGGVSRTVFGSVGQYVKENLMIKNAAGGESPRRQQCSGVVLGRRPARLQAGPAASGGGGVHVAHACKEALGIPFDALFFFNKIFQVPYLVAL